MYGLTTVALDHRPDLLALAADSGFTSTAVVSVRGWQLLLADPTGELTSLAELDRFADAVGWRHRDGGDAPSFPLAAGFLSDDLSPDLLSLPPDTRPAVAPLPAVRFGVYEWAVAVAPDGSGWIFAPPALVDRAEQWVNRRPVQTAPPIAAARAESSLARAQHAEAIAAILDWIAAGDLYQLNLTMQIAARWSRSGAALAQELEHATPGAAHAAFLTAGDTAIVSVSPETFLRTTGDVVVTRPIKGTRARLQDPRADAAAGRSLQASSKDHAEHLMIVDLERNDLGRVCEAGTVLVPEYAALEELPTVWHLTSTVRGTLRADVTLADLIGATFPPGSVTGTPKRMAVSRTALLEPVRRGVYCGAIGVVGAGMVDLSVAIRTAVLHDGLASYGTGGGIVADSLPADEYREAMAKAAAFLRATGATLD